MRVPVVFVTGVDPDAMASTMVALQWDLPNAVALRHDVDPVEQTLRRVVSDAGGVVEEHVLSLDHACVSCALREDIIPTLDRLASGGRWSSIVAHLPVGAGATQACQVLSVDTPLARHVRVAGVVAALAGSTCVHDLLGDDLLRERGLHSSASDARGVGETACAMVEYADAVALTEPADPTALDLVRVLGRPDALVVHGAERLDVRRLVDTVRDHDRAVSWVSAVRDEPLPPMAPSDVWRHELRSVHPFHPDRLLADLDQLGGGRHRSRGCFWLPTRPAQALVWDGSGGQLSVGSGAPWGRRAPFTRLVLVGVGAVPPRFDAAFASMLLGPDEAAARSWRVAEDGFEPWLGPLRDVA